VELAQVALSQGGLVTTAQCLAAGMTHHAVEWRLTSGRWQRLRRGVYLTHSGPADWVARAGAAVLASGAGAVLSHASAARLFGLVGEDPATLDVTVPSRNRARGVPGVRVHRVQDRSVRRRPWPPRTSVEDTILDLGRTVTLDEVTALAARACARRLTAPSRLADALRERHRYPARALLRLALGDIDEGAESLLEVRYIRGVEQRHALPKATRQARFAGSGRGRRDFELGAYRVIVEVDGRLWHEGRFLSDRQRDRRSTVRGWGTLRYTWAEVVGDPCAVAREIAAVLRGRGWTGTARPCSPRCRATLVA